MRSPSFAFPNGIHALPAASAWLVSVAISTCSSAQYTNANWLLNANASIHFTASGPSVLPNSHMHGHGRPTGSISSSNGALLLYHDLDQYWKGDHSPLPGGIGLNGTSLNDGSLIIPLDGSASRFSIVRQRAHSSPWLDRKLYHDQVELSGNGGQGEAVFIGRVLRDSMITAISATPIANGSGYWLITHEWGSDAWRVHKVDSAGLDTVPVISHSGEVHWALLGITSFGILKCSPAGDRIALVKTRFGNLDKRIEIFPFDAITGQVGPPIRISDDINWADVEFSRSGQFLYATKYPATFQQDTRLVQFDLSSNDSASIVNSMVVIDEIMGLTGSVGGYGQLALADDGKIYVSRYLDDHMGVIDRPDSAGTSCAFDPVGLDLGFLGTAILPKFIKFPNEFTVGMPAPSAPQARFHPNPFHTTARLHLPSMPHGPVLLHWHDARGRLLRTERHGPLHVIDLQRGVLPTGLVLLSASDEHGILARLKVVVE